MTMQSPQEIVDLAIGGWKAQVLFSAKELGVFDCIADEARPAEAIADKCQLEGEACARLLQAATALGLLDCEAGSYRCSPAVRATLVEGCEADLSALIMHVYRDVMPLWQQLSDAVREGSNRWKQVTGSEEGHFQNLYSDPQALETFLGTMHGFNAETAMAVSQALDWRGDERVLDVGGATAVFGHVLLEHYPGIQVTLLDLPEVCDIAQRWIRDDYGKADRMDTRAGDFLNEELPQGYDVIYLGWVLHDWDPETQVRLLEKCCRALAPGGRVVATECALAEDGNGPELTTLLSLDMLVSTDGGRESTASEYRRRFEAAGFPSVEHVELPVMRDAFVAVKR